MPEEKDNVIPWITLILLIVLIWVLSNHYKTPDIKIEEDNYIEKVVEINELENKTPNVNQSKRIYKPGDVTYPNGSDYPDIFHYGDIILSNGTIIKKGERIP